jgi:uncharacterized protein YjbJ (UPF0337 family)
MNTTELEGNWNELKGKLKQKFAVLTDNDPSTQNPGMQVILSTDRFQQ